MTHVDRETEPRLERILARCASTPGAKRPAPAARRDSTRIRRGSCRVVVSVARPLWGSSDHTRVREAARRGASAPPGGTLSGLADLVVGLADVLAEQRVDAPPGVVEDVERARDLVLVAGLARPA